MYFLRVVCTVLFIGLAWYIGRFAFDKKKIVALFNWLKVVVAKNSEENGF